MKILIVIPSHPKISGVDFHRLLQPHKRMGEIYKSEVQLFQINEIDTAEILFLQQFDLVVLNRFVSKVNNCKAVIEKLKQSGIPYLLDIDDDYKIPEWHILHASTKHHKHANQILDSINGAAAVTVTHGLVPDVLIKETLQKNYYIVPNGISPDGQFEQVPFRSKRVVFGWSGSITHFDDVMLMHDSLLSLYKSEHKDKFRVLYGGYTPTDENSKAIAGVLSCKGLAGKDNFAVYPAQGVHEYAKFYDHVNVSLIPLRDNRFNNMKSNLKLIESGFKKKAVICSGVQPYLPMLKHGYNCLVSKTSHDWYNNMVKLIKNPNLIVDLSEQLYEDVQVQHIDEIAKIRFNIYKEIICQKSL